MKMINTSWKTTVCAVASGLLLAIGACSSGQQEQQETLAISQSEEAATLGEEQTEGEFEVAEASNEAIDDALAETLAAVEGTEETGEEMPSVEDVLNQAEEAANDAVAEVPVEESMESMDAPLGEEVGQATEESLVSNESTPVMDHSNHETFIYTVQKGDWLSKIAKNVYGNSAMWQEVASENGLNNPNHIVPGQKLTFKVTNEQSRSFQDSYAKVNWHDGNNNLRNGEDGFYDVVVAKGDSLSKISERLFGDYSGWTKIYEANKAQITNPNLIFVGQKLTFSHSDAVAH